MTMPLVISFYTAHTEYEVEARRLLHSCNRLGIDHVIEPLPPRENWIRNCAMKGTFVREQLERRKRPVLWLDADAEVVRPLLYFRDAHFDLASYVRWPKVGQPPSLRCSDVPFMSGTVFFNYTQGGRRAAEVWAIYCEAYATVWDQVCLSMAWWDLRAEISFRLLPQGYCKVFDQPWYESDQTEFIIHHQASRRLRSKADNRTNAA